MKPRRLPALGFVFALAACVSSLLPAFDGDSGETDAAVSEVGSEQKESGFALPVPIHAGSLIAVETSDLAVSWIDLDNALLAKLFDPDEGKLPDDAVVLRPASPGTIYAILTIQLKKGRSLSRYDYSLVAGGETRPCLALASDDAPYDCRRWKVDGGPGQVYLLFEVPADAAEASLEFAMDCTIPQRTVTGIPLKTGPEKSAPGRPASVPVKTTPKATPKTAAAAPENKPAMPPKSKTEPTAPGAGPTTASPQTKTRKQPSRAAGTKTPKTEKTAPEKAAPKKRKPAAKDDAEDWF